ncbi:MAG: Nif3-like dinuclear metal center hexameric protein [Clostridia bacterium]|nr:Nif3-like dinuclear metal center hexameric protein [Clostridia bacterium]MBQ4640145.1 Nif3-like dinuclear metal center hexameric protein [Clostridia bacterium]
MQAKVSDFLAKLQEIAPFENAEAYDNVGLLLGKADAKVTKVLLALDATLEVAEEAKRIGAELIITHHPLMFHARKNLVEDDPEARVICALIRSHISLISAHTNLDKSIFSGSHACAEILGLKNIRQEGLLFLGETESELTAAILQERIAQLIDKDVRMYGDSSQKIRTLAICGGAYDEGWEEAAALGADAYLTGEVRHHNAIASVMAEQVMYDAGHFGTEATLIEPLCTYLQKWINDVKYDVLVFASKADPYGRV